MHPILAILLGLFTLSDSAHAILGGRPVKTLGDEVARSTVAFALAPEPGEAFSRKCSGTLLSDSIVLTAAHCIPHVEEMPERARIVFGPLLGKDLERAGARLRRRVVRMVASERIDVAIVVFAGGLPEGYRPVRYLTLRELRSRRLRGAPMIAAGYGRLNPPSDPESVLSEWLQKREFRFERFYEYNSEIHGFYTMDGPTRDPRSRGVASLGDSGGPIYYRENGELFVAGAVNDTAYAAVIDDAFDRLIRRQLRLVRP